MGPSKSGAAKSNTKRPKVVPQPSGKAMKAIAKSSAKGKGKAKKAESDSDHSDSSFDSSDSEDEDDRAAMLAALQAHGRAMFGATGEESDPGSNDEEEDDDDEQMVLESEDEGFHTDDGWGAGDAFVSDSEDEMGDIDAAFLSVKTGKGKGKGKAPKASKEKGAKPETVVSAGPVVPEVVFAPSTSSSASFVSKSEQRAFMKGNSMKMMGVKTEEVGRGKKRAREGDEEEEQSNLRLDKTLHDMLINTILPTANAADASRPVEKRNAMSGRLLELASYSLPGEGSARVKNASLSSHPAAVRTGLVHAADRRQERARAEAEAAGSWVKGVGGLGDAGKRGAGIRPTGGNAARGQRTFGLEVGKKKGMDGKKRERAMGLGMGVGSFKNGTLTISEREIARVNNAGKGGRGRGKKGKR